MMSVFFAVLFYNFLSALGREIVPTEFYDYNFINQLHVNKSVSIFINYLPISSQKYYTDILESSDLFTTDFNSNISSIPIGYLLKLNEIIYNSDNINVITNSSSIRSEFLVLSSSDSCHFIEQSSSFKLYIKSLNSSILYFLEVNYRYKPSMNFKNVIPANEEFNFNLVDSKFVLFHCVDMKVISPYREYSLCEYTYCLVQNETFLDNIVMRGSNYYETVKSHLLLRNIAIFTIIILGLLLLYTLFKLFYCRRSSSSEVNVRHVFIDGSKLAFNSPRSRSKSVTSMSIIFMLKLVFVLGVDDCYVSKDISAVKSCDLGSNCFYNLSISSREFYENARFCFTVKGSNKMFSIKSKNVRSKLNLRFDYYTFESRFRSINSLVDASTSNGLCDAGGNHISKCLDLKSLGGECLNELTSGDNVYSNMFLDLLVVPSSTIKIGGCDTTNDYKRCLLKFLLFNLDIVVYKNGVWPNSNDYHAGKVYTVIDHEPECELEICTYNRDRLEDFNCSLHSMLFDTNSKFTVGEYFDFNIFISTNAFSNQVPDKLVLIDYYNSDPNLVSLDNWVFLTHHDMIDGNSKGLGNIRCVSGSPDFTCLTKDCNFNLNDMFYGNHGDYVNLGSGLKRSYNSIKNSSFQEFGEVKIIRSSHNDFFLIPNFNTPMFIDLRTKTQIDLVMSDIVVTIINCFQLKGCYDCGIPFDVKCKGFSTKDSGYVRISSNDTSFVISNEVIFISTLNNYSFSFKASCFNRNSVVMLSFQGLNSITNYILPINLEFRESYLHNNVSSIHGTLRILTTDTSQLKQLLSETKNKLMVVKSKIPHLSPTSILHKIFGSTVGSFLTDIILLIIIITLIYCFSLSLFKRRDKLKKLL